MPNKKNPIQAKIEALQVKIGSSSDKDIKKWEETRSQFTSKQMIKQATDGAKDMIGKRVEPPEQLLFSFMPTTMTRTSPFFPMNKRQMKDRPIERGLTWETSWGVITVSGERLSVYDETVLLSLLALVKKHNNETFETTQYQLCKLSNVAPATNTYTAIWNSIQRLSGTRIDIKIWEGKGNAKKTVDEMTGAIISFARRNRKTDRLQVVVNPYFLQMYAEGLLTNLNLQFRAELKGDTSKALYRFYQGQEPLYKRGKYEIHLLKLCRAINLQVDNAEMRRLREQVRKGLKELRRQGYLKRWTINKQDMVIVWKDTTALLNN